MLGAILSKVPAVALTTTVTEQTKYINFPWNGVSRNHCREPQKAFSTHVQYDHTLVLMRTDDIIKVLLLLYTAILQIMRDDASCSDLFQFIYILQLWTLYIDNIIGTFDLRAVSLG